MSARKADDISRREALSRFLLGTSLLGVRSLASGIPVAWLLDPAKALAAARAAHGATAQGPGATAKVAATTQPQYLILSTSGSGDPVNCNAPGTYADTGILHPSASSMAATNLTINGAATTAAAPWASLPQTALDSMAFVHHATNTVVHPDEAHVLQLMGAVNNSAQFAGVAASLLAPKLGTVQAAPISLGAQGATEGVIYEGNPQPFLNPTALGAVLAAQSGVFATMQKQRDQDLNSLNAYLRANATQGQRNFLNAYATSQTQVRNISQSLIGELEALTDNSAASQVKAAVILAQLKIAPVISLHIPFGGDNHFDGGLGGEAAQTVTGVGSIGTLAAQLKSAGMQDQVTFAMINVFGRTMAKSNTNDNTSGRSHNQNHHVTVLMGSQVNGGVYGGVAASGNDYAALPIDSTSGQGAQNGDIALGDGLAAVGKTLGVALGLDATTMDSLITGGVVIKAAVKT